MQCMRSLIVWMKCSTLGTCLSLEQTFRLDPALANEPCKGSNLLSARTIWTRKPHKPYNHIMFWIDLSTMSSWRFRSNSAVPNLMLWKIVMRKGSLLTNIISMQRVMEWYRERMLEGTGVTIKTTSASVC